MKKLVDSFKAYEHVLSEDSVMDYFRSIINKCKKFAKSELKSCIEEFEEKLNKFHVERKEQDATTRNAMSYHKKVGKLGSIFRAKKGTVENGRNDNDTEDEASEVINPSRSEGSGLTSTEIDQVADNSEVLSPKTSRKGVTRSKVKANKGSVIRQLKTSSPIRSNIRPRRTRSRN